MVLSERNALISAAVMSAARADPIRPTAPALTMMTHATVRMICSSLEVSFARTKDYGSLLCLFEVSQIRRHLLLLCRHQIAVGTEHVVLLADPHESLALGTF